MCLQVVKAISADYQRLHLGIDVSRDQHNADETQMGGKQHVVLNGMLQERNKMQPLRMCARRACVCELQHAGDASASIGGGRGRCGGGYAGGHRDLHHAYNECEGQMEPCMMGGGGVNVVPRQIVIGRGQRGHGVHGMTVQTEATMREFQQDAAMQEYHQHARNTRVANHAHLYSGRGPDVRYLETGGRGGLASLRGELSGNYPGESAAMRRGAGGGGGEYPAQSSAHMYMGAQHGGYSASEYEGYAICGGDQAHLQHLQRAPNHMNAGQSPHDHPAAAMQAGHPGMSVEMGWWGGMHEGVYGRTGYGDHGEGISNKRPKIEGPGGGV